MPIFGYLLSNSYTFAILSYRDFPVVKFDAVKAVGKTDDDESESTEVENEFVISPEDWSNKLGDQTVSSRIQIPLRPAWSISVHKSQGRVRKYCRIVPC